MNDAHLHLIVNHFPIIVPITGLIILAAGYVTKSPVVQRTALGLFILGALFTFPAMYTGEGAEEIAEKLPGVTEALIEEHEEKAESLAIVNYLLGLISLFGFWASLKQKSFAGHVTTAIFILALAGLFFGRMAGTSGGEIRHTEIRSGADVLPADQGEEDED